MTITVQELRQKLDANETFLLLDVREPNEYEDFNLGGQLIPVGQIMNKMPDLENHKASEIVVYCRSGMRSRMVQGLLLANGFKTVRNLTGGVMEWVSVYGNAKV